MKKNLKMLISAAMICVATGTLFAGCGAAGNDDMQDGKVKLELFSTKGENKAIMESLVADFQVKNPDIRMYLRLMLSL